MHPEIYLGRNVGDVELIDARFYDGSLKEVTMVMHERPVSAGVLYEELRDQYGEPQSHTVDDTFGGGDGLPGLGLQTNENSVIKKLATFEQRHNLTWADAKNQMQVTIYTTTQNTAQPISIMRVHLAAAAWLNANQPAPATPMASLALPATNLAPPAPAPAPVVPAPAPAPPEHPATSGFLLNGKPMP
jgi:hypothetical protein